MNEMENNHLEEEEKNLESNYQEIGRKEYQAEENGFHHHILQQSYIGAVDVKSEDKMTAVQKEEGYNPNLEQLSNIYTSSPLQIIGSWERLVEMWLFNVGSSCLMNGTQVLIKQRWLPFFQACYKRGHWGSVLWQSG